MIHNLLAAPFLSMIIIFTRESPMKSSVIRVKTAFETRGQFGWIKYQCSYKSGSLVSVSVKDLG